MRRMGSSCKRVVAVSLYMHQGRSSGVIRANANCGHRPDNSGQFAMMERLREVSLGDGLLRAHSFQQLSDEPREEALALRGDGGVSRISERQGSLSTELECPLLGGSLLGVLGFALTKVESLWPMHILSLWLWRSRLVECQKTAVAVSVFAGVVLPLV